MADGSDRFGGLEGNLSAYCPTVTWLHCNEDKECAKSPENRIGLIFPDVKVKEIDGRCANVTAKAKNGSETQVGDICIDKSKCNKRIESTSTNIIGFQG